MHLLCTFVVSVCCIARFAFSFPVESFEKDLENLRNSNEQNLPEVDDLREVTRHIRFKVEKNFQDEVQVGKNERSKKVLQLKCATCILLVNYELSRVKILGGDFASVDDMVHWVADKCKLLKLETARVCKGALENFGGEVSRVLSQVNLTAEEVCGITMPDACPNYKVTTDNHKTAWNVSLPPKSHLIPISPRKFTIEGPTLKVLHLTDVHVDSLYKVGSTANCNEPLCCHGDDVTGDDIIEPIDPEQPVRDVHVSKQPAGQWGDYRYCDLPWWTFTDMMKNIQTRKIDYVIWTGDIPAHDVWSQSKRQQTELLFKLTSTLVEYLPFVPIYPAVGNHDSFPSNNFPPSKVRTSGKYSVTWFYKALAKAWAPWLGPEALKTVEIGGFYTTLVRPGHRIVSLNTNFCYNENWWIWLNQDDPSGMLQWFVQVLTEAEKNNEKVHVIGHVPPGKSPDCREEWSKNYFRIVERFRDIISGQFFGHTHFDEVLVYYGPSQRLMSVAYIGPSATPYAWLNPAYRIYDVSGFGSGWSVTNHRTYVMNLATANTRNTTVWYVEYDACQAFGVDKLSPAAWDKLLREWVKYNEDQSAVKIPESLKNYVKFYVRNDEISIPKLGGELSCSTLEDCVKEIVCKIPKNKTFDVCRKV
uniref:Sphingomyelin phosphodiesterase n=1 Tax=Phallusia mammillata TaxID=59560 RepID=A0A6F9DSH7_9ASCI|nr:sphingomyelin phosphodiesterase-like [Phallusia mammillata]